MATVLEQEEQSSRAVALSPQRESYAIMKDQARLFSISRLLPDAVRGDSPDEAMANCLIALQMAHAMNELPFMVMQNIHIVKGKAGFAAQFMIARANASGVFKGRINWRIDRIDPANLSVTAFATLAETGEEVDFTADMKMAQAEGWTSNAKYKSMPELMLRYRSATFLVRLYAPDVMLGYRTADELEDISASVAPSASALTADMLTDQAKPTAEGAARKPETGEIEIVEAEVVDSETARELDAGAQNEPDDPDQTEAEEPAAEETESSKRLRIFRGRIADAENDKVLRTIDKDWVLARAAYDDDTCAEIDGLIGARRRELVGEGGE
jgi:hypothetical protein